ncbi:MAG: hypothetical protein QN178_17005 [Armatimonadota bacterium]|nr:hypothetical protein [Armatimonadota bacterium]
MTRPARRGLTLVETIIALSLMTIVFVLIGSLFVASLSTWRRGADLRLAQVEASTLVDLMARDIRSASQAPGPESAPAAAEEDGEPALSMLVTGSPATGAQWVVYAWRARLGEVTRRTFTPAPDGRPVRGDVRIVATGVEQLTVTRIGDGLSIEARVRRGRDVATSRATASPRNP